MVKANIDYTTLESEEQIRLNYLFVNWITLWHTAFLDHIDELLDKRAWGIWDKGFITVLRKQVAFRHAWFEFGHAWFEFGHVYDDEFRHYVDAILEEIGPVATRVEADT